MLHDTYICLLRARIALAIFIFIAALFGITKVCRVGVYKSFTNGRHAANVPEFFNLVFELVDGGLCSHLR